MFFANLYADKKKSLSFEFFPPKSEHDLPETKRVFASLAQFNPSFMTVTSGVEQNKRALSRALVFYVRHELELPVIAHQTCWGLSRAEIDASLDELEKGDVNLVLALRGDPAKSFSPDELANRGFENALEFTSHIVQRGGFEVAVAGYPETHRDAQSAASDLEYLKQKVDVGAQVVLTQLFFEPSVFFRFLENTSKLGISTPIVPGVLPISSASQLERFVSLTGVSIPSNVKEAVDRYRDDTASLSAWGIDYAIRQCHALLEGGASGIHLYTLNKETQTQQIAKALIPFFPGNASNA